MSNLIASLSLCVSIISALIALAAYRVQRRGKNMEVARLLHADLTSGEVAEAREILGTIIYDPRRITSTGEESLQARYVKARTAYFTLQWCFERIQAGRNMIIADGDNMTCRYLDQIIEWHVFEWAKGLPIVKDAIEKVLGGLDDPESQKSFSMLCKDVLSATQRAEVQALLISKNIFSY